MTNNNETLKDKTGMNIRRMDNSSLILVKADGTVTTGRTRADKDSLVQQFDAKVDILLLAWHGQRKTDMFRVTEDDLRRNYGD